MTYKDMILRDYLDTEDIKTGDLKNDEEFIRKSDVVDFIDKIYSDVYSLYDSISEIKGLTEIDNIREDIDTLLKQVY